MGEQGNESDEELTAGIEADRVPRASLQFFRAIIKSLDKLEHRAGFRLSTLTRGGSLENVARTYHST